MEHTDVVSSQITSVGYDPDQQHLEIKFKRGGLYRYRKVPAQAHADLMAADSVGSHFHRHIRNQYDYERLN